MSSVALRMTYDDEHVFGSVRSKKSETKAQDRCHIVGAMLFSHDEVLATGLGGKLTALLSLGGHRAERYTNEDKESVDVPSFSPRDDVKVVTEKTS